MSLKHKTLFSLFAALFFLGYSAPVFACDQDQSCHPPIKKGTLLEMAEQSGKFKILLEALKITGLDEELKKEGPVTLLAPTDEAFKRMSPQELEELLRDKEYLADLLLHHVIEGAVKIGDAISREVVNSMKGQELFFYKDDAGTFVNDSKVIMADIEATNGVAHVIDTVLFPRKK